MRKKRVGSFNQFLSVDDVIEREREIFPRRRQVVSVILMKPDSKALCLCLAEGSLSDGKLNLAPPQGGIKEHETLCGATVRELREEIKVEIFGSLEYLGSVVRTLLEDHRHKKNFDECHHHWVVGRATSESLYPQPPLAEARWHHLSDLADGQWNGLMSEDKAKMFGYAYKYFFGRSGQSKHSQNTALQSA